MRRLQRRLPTEPQRAACQNRPHVDVCPRILAPSRFSQRACAAWRPTRRGLAGDPRPPFALGLVLFLLVWTGQRNKAISTARRRAAADRPTFDAAARPDARRRRRSASGMPEPDEEALAERPQPRREAPPPPRHRSRRPVAPSATSAACDGGTREPVPISSPAAALSVAGAARRANRARCCVRVARRRPTACPRRLSIVQQQPVARRSTAPRSMRCASWRFRPARRRWPADAGAAWSCRSSSTCNAVQRSVAAAQASRKAEARARAKRVESRERGRDIGDVADPHFAVRALPRDRESHRDAMVAVAVDVRRHAAGRHGSRAPSAFPRPRCRARAGPRAIVAMRSDSLTRSSAAPRTCVAPSAQAAATNSAGNSSIMSGTCSTGTSMPRSGAWRTTQVGDRLRRPARRILLDDVGAHRPQHAQQPGAARIHADRAQARGRSRAPRVAATRKNAADEKSAGTDTSVARRRWPPRQRASPGANAIGQPKARKHALGVIAGRMRFAHLGFALRIQAREQHRRLHLRARDRPTRSRCPATACRRRSAAAAARPARRCARPCAPADRARAASAAATARHRRSARCRSAAPPARPPAGACPCRRCRSRAAACGACRPSMPTPCTMRAPAPGASMRTPSFCEDRRGGARVFAFEEAIDARARHRRCAASMIARCETDLSPGTCERRRTAARRAMRSSRSRGSAHHAIASSASSRRRFSSAVADGDAQAIRQAVAAHRPRHHAAIEQARFDGRRCARRIRPAGNWSARDARTSRARAAHRRAARAPRRCAPATHCRCSSSPSAASAAARPSS